MKHVLFLKLKKNTVHVNDVWNPTVSGKKWG